MREIKFRGSGVDGHWWYGESNPQGEYHVNLATFFANAHGGVIRPETIGEYAGRKDSKSRDVYEGDIIKGLRDADLDYSTQIAQVEFRGSAFVETYFGRPLSEYTDSYHYGNTIEVIVNVTENPELLK